MRFALCSLPSAYKMRTSLRYRARVYSTIDKRSPVYTIFVVMRRFFLLGFILISCFKDEPPEVKITTPSHGNRVTGEVVIQAIATDDFSVEDVEFYIDEQLIGIDTARPYFSSWYTDTIISLTDHQVIVTAHDSKDQAGDDTISLTVDHSLKPPTINSIDTSDVRSTSLWLNWESDGAESVLIYRSLAPGIDTIEDIVANLPDDSTEYHDLWLIQDKPYYYLIIAKDAENQKAVSPVLRIKTAKSQTLTWLLNSNAVPNWLRDGNYIRASSREELRMILGDSADPYIRNEFIDFTYQPYKGKLGFDPPDTNHLDLFLFDMQDSTNAKAVYNEVDPGNMIPFDSIGDEARYYFDSKYGHVDFRRRNGFVRIYINCGLPQAIDVIMRFALLVDYRIL